MVPFSRMLYIERDDFSENPPKGWHRLAPGAEVRLRYGFIIRCDDVVRDDAGEVIELRCTYDPATRGGAAPEGRNVKGTIHWVSAHHALKCEVRLYDRLFTHPDPESGDDADFRARLNPDSLVVIRDARIEPSVDGVDPRSRFQFERLGYFMTDPIDSRPDALVFNRTVTLRDTWAKHAPGGDAKVSDGRPDRSAGKSKPARTSAPQPRAIVERDAVLEERRRRYGSELGLGAEQADVLTRDASVAALFEDALATGAPAATVANIIVNEMPREAREKAGSLSITGAAIGGLARMIDGDEISTSAAREVLAELIEKGGDPTAIVEARGLRQISDESSLRSVVEEVLAANAAKAEEYRAGRKGLLGLFVGQAMSRTRGRANPALLKRIVEELLG